MLFFFPLYVYIYIYLSYGRGREREREGRSIVSQMAKAKKAVGADEGNKRERKCV